MKETTEKKRPTQSVKTFTHCLGHTVRLPNERLARIFERTEMNMMGAEIERLLATPQIVLASRSDAAVRLFYAFYPETIVGGQIAVCGCKVLAERCLRGHCLPYGQTKIRINIMADKLKVWFDPEADFLEVRFSDAAGYEKATNHDAVMERVDAEGHVIGFSIMGVSQVSKEKPLEADLVSA
jgi:hypothetical protein